MTGSAEPSGSFGALVRQYVEPVVSRAGFEWNSSGEGDDTALFEAEPNQFRERYEHLMPDYGDQQPLCIDLWIKRLVAEGRVEADLEGTDLGRWLRERGHNALAEAMVDAGGMSEAVQAIANGLDLLLGPQPEGVA